MPRATLERVTDELVEPGEEWRLGRVRIQVRPLNAKGQNATGAGSFTVTLRGARLSEVRRLIEQHVVEPLTSGKVKRHARAGKR